MVHTHPDTTITAIDAREIQDSRGDPTLSVTVKTAQGSGTFDVPSGASTGSNEAVELRDEDGSVKPALENIQTKIASSLIGQDVLNQRELDDLLLALDGTSTKEKLGGNAMIGVSIAAAKAAASSLDMPLYSYLSELNSVHGRNTPPYLFVNLINGGEHAKTDLSFQEFHIIPEYSNVTKAYKTASDIKDILETLIREQTGQESVVMGDEGGFASPALISTEDALRILKKATQMNDVEEDVSLGLDVAANSFYKDGVYIVDGKEMNADEFLRYYSDIIEEFFILSIEDPFYEKDAEYYKALHERYPQLVIVGDDLTTTNPAHLKKELVNQSINALIIKPNQVGTLTETLETISLAHKYDVKCIVSHRSGETLDDFIADLAYGCGCFGLKAGAPGQPERDVKYERLMEIVGGNKKQ